MCPPPCRCQARQPQPAVQPLQQQVTTRLGGLAAALVPRYLAALIRGRQERQQRRWLIEEFSRQIRAETEAELEPLRRIAYRLHQTGQEASTEIRIVTPTKALPVGPRSDNHGHP